MKYHPRITHNGPENKRNDRQLTKLLFNKLLNKFSPSEPQGMYRDRRGEYA